MFTFVLMPNFINTSNKASAKLSVERRTTQQKIRIRENAELKAKVNDLALLLRKQNLDNAFMIAKVVKKRAEKETYKKIYRSGEN